MPSGRLFLGSPGPVDWSGHVRRQFEHLVHPADSLNGIGEVRCPLSGVRLATARADLKQPAFLAGELDHEGVAF